MKNQGVRVRLRTVNFHTYGLEQHMLFEKYQIPNCPQTVFKTLTK